MGIVNGIDFEPDEEQQRIVETARQFAEHEIRPVARGCDESAKLPEPSLRRAHELSLVANVQAQSPRYDASPTEQTALERDDIEMEADLQAARALSRSTH